MSMERNEIITCPKCGKESEFTIWQSITKPSGLSGRFSRSKKYWLSETCQESVSRVT
jgi:hypothetical protein